MRTFEALFGRAAEATGEAPGRVNLIGEHTDYNGGFVLPAAIAQRTRVEAAARPDRLVRLWSAQYPDRPVEFTLGTESRAGDWADYVKGMTYVLAERAPLTGFDARVDSEVPAGSGLASSAALEIAVGRALRTLCRIDIDDVALARAGQRAENELVGAPVGIMDQMACSLADTTSALFLDTRTLDFSRVPIPAGAGLLVIDSGVSHDHARGDYRTRRAECEEAARLLGVPQLRDLTLTDLARAPRLPAPLDRRARHVVTENQRVFAVVAAFEAGDLNRAGRLFTASHASLRDDFGVSIEPIDVLVDAALAVPGVYGARLTGGGFGGAVVALVASHRVAVAADEIVTRYQRLGHPAGRVLVPAR